MANIYTDDARVARYEKLRRQKKIYEAVFAVCMIILLLISLIMVFSSLFRGAIWGLFLNQMGDFWMGIGLLLCAGFAVYALFTRNWRWIIAAAVITGFLTGGLFSLPLLPSLVVSFFWENLKNEEGFPDFKVTGVEQKNSEQKIVQNLEKRALQEGTRVRQEALDPDAGMGDLLEDNQQVLPAELRNYHERSSNADPVARAADKHDSVMDTLEDL
jgi:MFS family permease